jgi:hypothetical protein
MLSIHLESSWQRWCWMDNKISQMLRIHTLKIVPDNVMLCGSVFCSCFLFVNHVCSVRKTPEWPLCVYCFLYYIFRRLCNLAAILQHVWYDVLLFDNVPVFWSNLCTTQLDITFQQTVILILSVGAYSWHLNATPKRHAWNTGSRHHFCCRL